MGANVKALGEGSRCDLVSQIGRLPVISWTPSHQHSVLGWNVQTEVCFFDSMMMMKAVLIRKLSPPV